MRGNHERQVDAENASDDKAKRALTLLAAAVVPVVASIVALACAGCIPFGDGFPEGWDCFTQYVEYLDWYRGILTGGNDLFYSFGKSLGGSTIGIYGYYLASPLNVLILLFPEGTTPVFMVVVGIVKVGLAGLTASIFMSRRFGLNGLLNIALSCGYAMCAYVANWMLVGFMWMDAVVLLPLVALGVYRWLTQRRRALFLVSLALVIVCCWYTGYMVCLFAVFYLPCEYVALFKGRGVRTFLGTYLRFGGLLAIGVLLSAFLLLPVVFAQMGGESVDFQLVFYCVFSPLKATGALFIGSAYYYVGAPQLFSGTLAMVGCFLFLFNKGIAPREKVARCVLFLFVLACAYIQAGNEIWCGLRIPRGYDCRFAFVLAFMLVSAAARSLGQLEGLRLRSICLGGGIVLVVALVALFLKTFVSMAYFAAAMFFIVVATACLAVLVTVGRRSELARIVACVVLVCATAIEMSANMSYIERSTIDEASPVQAYSDYRVTERARYQELTSRDDSWYRLEKTYSRLDNFGLEPPDSEGLVLGYSGISTYSSAPDEELYDVLALLGYSRTDMGSANYMQPIVTSDALLGLKYIMNSDGTTWRNPYALSLGYLANKAILQPLENVSTTGVVDNNANSEGTNPFEVQNQLYSNLLGRTVEVFKPLPVTQTVLEGEKVTWSVDTQGRKYTYGYVNSDNVVFSNLEVNGNDQGEYLTWESYYVFSLGTGENGDASGEGNIATAGPATVTLSATAPIYAGHQNELLAYYVDEDVLKDVMGELAQHQLSVQEFRDGYVRGTISSDSDALLFTTVPYDEGWTVSVNGQKVDYEKAAGAFIAIPVSAGDSEIVMTYVPKGLVPGVALSVATLAGLLVYAGVKRTRLKRR